MPSRFSFTLAGKTFKSKKALSDRIKEILYGYAIGSCLQGHERVFIIEMLSLHPEAATKIGCGIRDVTVESSIYGARGFFFHRYDGTKTDASYLKCLNPESSRYNDLQSAFRIAVAKQVREVYWKAFQNGPFACEFTGQILQLDDGNSAVDHVPPKTFQALLNSFLALRGLELNDIVITGSKDMEMEKHIVDERLKADWQEYHAKEAVLRVISKLANTSHVRKIAKRVPQEPMP
jgi:hypothetical protein